MKIIRIEPDNLILPEEISFVFLQPYLELDCDANRHFIKDSIRELILNKITKTCDVALNLESASPTSFIVFPEYSVTYPEGFDCIEKAILPSKVNNLIVIGGLEGIKQKDYLDLQQKEIFKGQKIDFAGTNGEWINTAFIFLKGSDGKLSLYLQPKICPSPTLENGMYSQSDFMYLWNIKRSSRSFKFFISICFDLISQEKGTFKSLECLEEESKRDNKVENIDMIFNIQRNDQLNHDSFATAFQKLFNNSVYPNVDRKSMAVFVANNAGFKLPGKCDSYYGNSSMIFQKGALHPTYKTDKNNKSQDIETFTFYPPKSDNSRKYLNNDNLNIMVFREKGDAIHSFVYHPLATLQTTTGSPAPILPKDSKVYGTTDYSDNRSKGQCVPSHTKWFLDELDRFKEANFPIFKKEARDFRKPIDGLIESFKGLPDQIKYFSIMKKGYAFYKQGEEKDKLESNADHWDKYRTSNNATCAICAFDHYFTCLVHFKIACEDEVNLNGAEEPAHVKIGNKLYFFITGENSTDLASHIQDLLEEYFPASSQSVFKGREDPIEVICIVRPEENPALRCEGSITFTKSFKNVNLKKISFDSFMEIVRNIEKDNFSTELEKFMANV